VSDFDGLVALVTGGASGIGAATARHLLGRGARVAVLDRSTDGVPEGVLALDCDVTDAGQVDGAVAEVVERLGGLDVVVNNAGIGAVGDVAQNDDAEWARVLDINVTGTARVTAAALPWLHRSGAAAVVNLCSVAADNGLPDRALYSASKGAVLALTLAMANDHVREGVRINCVKPGTVSTPWVDRTLEKYADPVAERAALDARQATGRMVTPEEVADAILYLASPRSRSTTGTALTVDGGLSHLRMRPQSS
jgi:NAD(P)-dependent dehydrogenase (short-subunit alcohol dehydrogenase family)